MPKSKNLFEKLSKQKRAQLLPMREYSLQELISDKCITNIFIPNCNAFYKYFLLNIDHMSISLSFRKKVYFINHLRKI